MPNIPEPDWLPFILIVLIPIFFAAIHLSIAINLYKFGKKYEAEYGVPFFFMHPIILGITGLMFGLLAALLSSVVLAISGR